MKKLITQPKADKLTKKDSEVAQYLLNMGFEQDEDSFREFRLLIDRNACEWGISAYVHAGVGFDYGTFDLSDDGHFTLDEELGGGNNLKECKEELLRIFNENVSPIYTKKYLKLWNKNI